jgi:site-specific DNA recombinase
MTADSHASEPVQAAVYARISLAGMDDHTKTDDQVRQCREVAARRGWNVAEVYVDNSKSAWRKDRKRSEWDRMLADVRAGLLGAIITYWQDRLCRQNRDLEDLLDLRDVRNIRLASVTGEYDFDNPDHRMMMRWEVARACNESDTLSRRKKNQYERWRREGRARPGGPAGRAFGFETDGFTHVPAETAVVRRAAAAVLAGQSLGSLARQLASEGVRTVTGQPVHQTGLRRALLYPRTAALMPDGVSPASWEPVLDRATWEAVRAALSGNTSVPNAGRGALHLLSGIAECDLCGHVLWSGYNAGIPAYKCHACGKIGRSIAHMDAYVTGRVLARLANPANPAAEPPGGDVLAAEILALEQRRAATVRLLDDLASHPGERPELLYRAVESFDRRLAELRERAAGDSRERLRRQHQGMTRDQFDAAPLSLRRSLVAACYRVTVKPSSRRGPGFRPADVLMEPIGTDPN